MTIGKERNRKIKAEHTEYKMASKLKLKRSFHLEKSGSAITATMNDCTALNMHWGTTACTRTKGRY
jgi:hypothetical protein